MTVSITGGITDSSLFDGTGNDSFNFVGGRVSGVDTGTGADSVVLSDTGADTVTITGALTGTTLKAGTTVTRLLSSQTYLLALSVLTRADTINFASAL